MRNFIVRLNTLFIILSILYGVGVAAVTTYEGHQKLVMPLCKEPQNLSDQQQLDWLNAHPESWDTCIVPTEVYEEAHNEWKRGVGLGIGTVFMVCLISAVVSWLFGAGFRVHLRL